MFILNRLVNGGCTFGIRDLGFMYWQISFPSPTCVEYGTLKESTRFCVRTPGTIEDDMCLRDKAGTEYANHERPCRSLMPQAIH